jgi:hypothetical protein
MHPRGVQDRYFNSLRNRVKMGTGREHSHGEKGESGAAALRLF